MQQTTAKTRYFLGCKVTRANGILLGLGLLFISLAVAAKMNTRYETRWNISESINANFFIIDKSILPERGEYVAFNYYDITNEHYKSGMLKTPPQVVFIKKVIGVAGDTVSQQNREFFVNGQSAGIAKIKSKGGRPLKANEFQGVIPSGYYYVHTPHKDSYDSRYADVGLIPVAEIRGVAYAY
ncbi:S26 family signal peptidase [Moraxella catarrhalis]|uniref:S26 family signal peptidase n=1 Tax=Moraxella catarrhalis TaxID=480 RepID=UPI00128C79AA|nr:S26 family signal peptidase [Moraxella catarrhalis]MPY09025.1 peptidase [Moraxella catarrhalis]